MITEFYRVFYRLAGAAVPADAARGGGGRSDPDDPSGPAPAGRRHGRPLGPAPQRSRSRNGPSLFFVFVLHIRPSPSYSHREVLIRFLVMGGCVCAVGVHCSQSGAPARPRSPHEVLDPVPAPGGRLPTLSVLSVRPD